jgi:hypothetical protein
MTTASNYMSKWKVGDTIDSLTILQIEREKNKHPNSATCTVLCGECGSTSQMGVKAIHTRHFKNKNIAACKACNYRLDNGKRSKSQLKNKNFFDYTRFTAGNTIGNLKILSVEKSEGKERGKWEIKTECQECKKESTVQAEFLIAKVNKGMNLCRFCAVVEREKNPNKSTPIAVSAITPPPEPEKVYLNIKNKAFDLLRYKIGRSASRVSFA